MVGCVGQHRVECAEHPRPAHVAPVLSQGKEYQYLNIDSNKKQKKQSYYIKNNIKKHKNGGNEMTN